MQLYTSVCQIDEDITTMSIFGLKKIYENLKYFLTYFHFFFFFCWKNQPCLLVNVVVLHCVNLTKLEFLFLRFDISVFLGQNWTQEKFALGWEGRSKVR